MGQLVPLHRAAALGNSDGIVNTGLMLRLGLGAPRNLTAAHAYFVQCAATGHASCHYQAAMLEAAGEEGIARWGGAS
jgi:SEL1 protein